MTICIDAIDCTNVWSLWEVLFNDAEFSKGYLRQEESIDFVTNVDDFSGLGFNLSEINNGGANNM